MSTDMPSFEIAAFTVRPENEEALLRERPEMIAALKRAYPGALAAWLTRDESGRWLDIILWRSRDEAEQAARELDQIPEARRWFRHIADTEELRHLEVAHEALWPRGPD
jgi:Antibiotic biosynthesis monooxygenase